MRFKYYLRGCGLGILLATIVLAIGFHRNSSAEMTDAEIRQRASELGMIDDPDSVWEEATQLLENTEIAKETNTTENFGTDTEQPEISDNTEPEETEDVKKDNKKENNKKEDTSKGDTETEGDTNPKTVTLKVTRGMVCRDIAEQLYELNMVDDAEAFRLYMRDEGYDNLIQTGTFTFTVGMEYQEIAEILTTKE